jgi:hypothetical protein
MSREEALPGHGAATEQLVAQALSEFGVHTAMLETKEQGLFVGAAVSGLANSMPRRLPLPRRRCRVRPACVALDA